MKFCLLGAKLKPNNFTGTVAVICVHLCKIQCILYITLFYCVLLDVFSCMRQCISVVIHHIQIMCALGLGHVSASDVCLFVFRPLKPKTHQSSYKARGRRTLDVAQHCRSRGPLIFVAEMWASLCQNRQENNQFSVILTTYKHHSLYFQYF